jgi:hypothetical protein
MLAPGSLEELHENARKAVLDLGEVLVILQAVVDEVLVIM